MEKFFKYLSTASASFVFVILIATLIVLYINAQPAIKSFGLGFVTDPRWGVEVADTSPSIKKDAGTSTKTPTSIIKESSTENSAYKKTDDYSADIEDNSIGTEYSETEDDTLTDTDIDDEFDDDEIPMDDDINTGQSGLSDNGKTRTIYGAGVPVVGTLLTTLIAMFFSIPIAMGIAVFLSEIAHEKLVAPIGIAIELLAAVPSIIYGMWALFYFGPFVSAIFGGHSVSLLVAGLVLGVMVIPFMAALSRDAINTTPDVLKESAYAMGATKFEVIKDIIFPYAKAGIIGSIIVSLGRAMGETMAVAFVIGGVFKFAGKLTDPTNSIPVVLANNFAESSGLSMNALFYLALILFLVSFVVIFMAKYFFLRRSHI